jgi:hypothetical protein
MQLLEISAKGVVTWHDTWIQMSLIRVCCCCLCVRAGGERVLEVFDVKLKEAIYKLPFDKILTLKNVSHTLGDGGGRGLHMHCHGRAPGTCA